jgi:hypothetical protein
MGVEPEKDFVFPINADSDYNSTGHDILVKFHPIRTANVLYNVSINTPY